MNIAILGAMEQEIALIKNAINNIEITQLSHLTFYHGSLNNHNVVLVQCGIGKVASALATTLAIQHFKPDYVVNTGSAGGFDETLNIGDVVIGTGAQHHDVDLTHFGYELGQCSGMPAIFQCDERLVNAAYQASELLTDIQTVKGLICTGDSFIGSDEVAQSIKTSFPEMKACEMEGAAIAQTCHILNIPCVIIRSLSDIAGKTSTVSFQAYLETAAKNSAHLVMNMIKLLPSS